MENKKESDEEFVSRLTKPIFERVLQETPKNRTLVGFDRSVQETIAYFQPHNYRLYFDFSKENFNPNQTPKTEPQTLVWSVARYKVRNKIEHNFQFENATITIKKTQAEVITKIKHKQWFTIILNDKIEQQVKDIVDMKDKECINLLKDFIKIYGGKSEFKVLNRHSESKVEREDKIDLIPIKMKFDTPIVKKVYNERNIEFKSPVYAATYLENRAIEKIAPEIAQDLNINKELIKGILEVNASTSNILNQQAQLSLSEANTLLEFKRDVKVHNKALKGIVNAFNKFNRLLSERQKRLGEWL